MPSVGMRRSTRVFGARVLRSGRQMWTEPREDIKYRRAVGGGNEWIRLLRNSADEGGDGSDGFNDLWQENEHLTAVEINAEPQIEENALEVRNMDKPCVIVYKRKRKRVELTSTGLSQEKRFGKKFVRRQWRENYRSAEPETCARFMSSTNWSPLLAVVANKSSYDSGYWISCFLSSVLSYMARARIGIRQLSAFVLVQPIFAAYSSGGVLFYQDSIPVNNPGFCIIWESSSFIPVFAVDFSAIPFCFDHMHTSMHLGSLHLARLLESHSVDSDVKDEEMTDLDFAESPPQVPLGRDPSCHVAVVSQSDDSGRRELSHTAVGLPKSPIGMMQLRSSHNIGKRSSLRRKRGRPSSAVRARKDSEALASGFFRIRQNGVQFPAAVPSHAPRKLDKGSLRGNIKELNPAPRLLTKDMRFASCAANLLIIEPDKCYREGGVIITLDLSASEKWSLAVVKDGMKRYSLTAQKVMMPSYSNRFTHATVWAAGGGWKLEFPYKQDWLIFKELYKECSDLNVRTPVASVIPLPGVQEVPITADSNCKPYVRPGSYITVANDELTRAMVKKSANYDMDSDDEKWLDKFNDELYADMEIGQLVTPETFELIIDALEKDCHCNPDDYWEEQAAYDFCRHLERKEVVEAIRNYWIKKRKQKCAALVRIFELYQPRRTEVIPKSVLRKKRTFKRHASQGGRAKQRTFLQAMVAKRDALQQNNLRKVQEAKATASRSEGLSFLKRQRAQVLMENADLATYKAIMALRIAEAAKVAEAPGMIASFFLG
ncbi:hypothetical protein CDL12_07359 [Handroanthus impetiginosus]|uniref:Enhancer of polycomb-like protein n=1 Tax=Handroanthus impetiginosus TaxID=429701 RepID=A0A2G9HR14_9LAMI|nr:hypothetical protein CDL12_07359 [Handroanthus impetiginosus]